MCWDPVQSEEVRTVMCRDPVQSEEVRTVVCRDPVQSEDSENSDVLGPCSV